MFDNKSILITGGTGSFGQVMTWEASGLGVRRFCRQQGLAVSTFGRWRKKLAGEISIEANRLVVTPHVVFVAARPDGAPLAPSPSVTTDRPLSSRDRVTARR